MIGEFTLSELASELGLSVTLSALKKDAAFSAVTTDSRNLSAGDLYVALKGERFNGDEFVEEALTKGAVAAVTHQSDAQADAQRLVVDDTLSALATLARLNRDRSSAKVIALTGSQGKTSVKEMIGSILKLSLIHISEPTRPY